MGSARTAVVVEDDDDIRELITHSLTMQGFEVSAASSGQAGLELVVATDPDLVTLDLGLPDLDGIEVCRRVRDVSQAYVVMISARTDEIDRLMGLEIGADDYLTKPFSPRELQARVNAMFRRPRTVRSRPPVADESPAAARQRLVVDSPERIAPRTAVDRPDDATPDARAARPHRRRPRGPRRHGRRPGGRPDPHGVRPAHHPAQRTPPRVVPRRAARQPLGPRLVRGAPRRGARRQPAPQAEPPRPRRAMRAPIRTVRGVGYRMEEPDAF